ncbi:hypothetical protein HAX54_044840 [Datura stramonium]|uniref:Uncharacterized protein n=1 Tax=Datura stramonium TaxID=4076 RepID=A0ABS8SR54_DATST|nr:hypothetical protein [Datura stramonium]
MAFRLAAELSERLMLLKRSFLALWLPFNSLVYMKINDLTMKLTDIGFWLDWLKKLLNLISKLIQGELMGDISSCINFNVWKKPCAAYRVGWTKVEAIEFRGFFFIWADKADLCSWDEILNRSLMVCQNKFERAKFQKNKSDGAKELESCVDQSGVVHFALIKIVTVPCLPMDNFENGWTRALLGCDFVQLTLLSLSFGIPTGLGH